ncbi:MAG: 5-formyltetrahydrofolate cyclo-ligase [Clostridiales bacterium]|jgi:5-formyltetrahydrofolate cyclo-ligase|nr:5-formyltetrahydrofolate cyclo-ligase [Clostridiales bacterium]
MKKTFKMTSGQVAMLAVFLGLMLLLTFVAPLLNVFGFIGTAFIVLIIIAVGALSEGRFIGIATGTMFGIISLIASFILPQPLAPCFQNPLISVLPRIFIGLVVYTVYGLLDKAIKNKKKNKAVDYAKFGIAAATGAIFNTLTVMGMIWLFFGGRDVTSGEISTAITPELILAVIATNGTLELALTLILTPPIVMAVTRFKRTLPPTRSASKKAQRQVFTDENGGIETSESDKTDVITVNAVGSIPEQKAALRKAVKARLNGLGDEYRYYADGRIFECVTCLESVEKAKNIGIYASCKKEPDTRRLIEYLLENGKNLFLPVTDTDGRITFIGVDRDTRYAVNSYGIEEPISTGEKTDASLDLIIVPLLSFDSERNRLGRGKGCYDAFLRDSAAVTVGLAYAAQEAERVPTEEFDVRLGTIITEEAVF